jgi:hypothetical protein
LAWRSKGRKGKAICGLVSREFFPGACLGEARKAKTEPACSEGGLAESKGFNQKKLRALCALSEAGGLIVLAYQPPSFPDFDRYEAAIP